MKIYQFDCFHRHMLATTPYYSTKAHDDVIYIYIFWGEGRGVCNFYSDMKADFLTGTINSTTGRILASV